MLRYASVARRDVIPSSIYGESTIHMFNFITYSIYIGE
jgi:hypothetical protein